MTTEEAIGRVKAFGLFHAERDLPHSELTVEAFKMAIEALEKQVPKKPKVNHYEEEGEKPYTKICCPNGCHIQLYPVTEKQLAHEHIYCPKCGQKIDWSEE